MLSVLHTNVIAGQYFILSFNLVALCFVERTLHVHVHILLKCINKPTLLVSSNMTDITYDESLLFVFIFLCDKGKQRRLNTLSCHLPVIYWSWRCWLGGMSMWGTIRTMEGGDSSVTLVAILALQNLYVTQWAKSTKSSYRTRNIVMVLVGGAWDHTNAPASGAWVVRMLGIGAKKSHLNQPASGVGTDNSERILL